MDAIASQITSLTTVYSIVYSDADQRKHQSSASLAFVREFTGDRWILRTNGQLRGKCFHLMTSSWCNPERYHSKVLVSNHKAQQSIGIILGISLCCLSPNFAELQVQYHYGDVIMSTIASQITSLTIVYSTVYSDADQRKHQSSASLAFVWGIHRGPVNSPHKWRVMWKMFPFDDVIMMLSQSIIELASPVITGLN